MEGTCNHDILCDSHGSKWVDTIYVDNEDVSPAAPQSGVPFNGNGIGRDVDSEQKITVQTGPFVHVDDNLIGRHALSFKHMRYMNARGDVFGNQHLNSVEQWDRKYTFGDGSNSAGASVSPGGRPDGRNPFDNVSSFGAMLALDKDNEGNSILHRLRIHEEGGSVSLILDKLVR